MSSEINYSDVQGLVRFGYGWMKEAIYLLMRVKDVAAARSWLLSCTDHERRQVAFFALHRNAGRLYGARPQGAWRLRVHYQRLFS
jgi:hypothetical protein